MDIVLASVGLAFVSPLLVIAAIGIKISSPGPILFRTKRVGLNGDLFTIYKLRTMHHAVYGAPITTREDSRVFRLGNWLRKSKIDELPQLWNVLEGTMALVGPRPEDPSIVNKYYTDAERRTLQVRPGLTSPGSLYYYEFCEHMIDPNDPVGSYARDVMPSKLALDASYVERANIAYDIALISRTLVAIVRHFAGGRPKHAVGSLPEAASRATVSSALDPLPEAVGRAPSVRSRDLASGYGRNLKGVGDG
jgi:lipopolysaccharide/colanic/teichoic acid biosynthesis glycosyltransferase